MIEKVAISSDIAYFISTSQWLDATSPPLERHVEELANIVAQMTGKTVKHDVDKPELADTGRPVDYSPALLDSWEKAFLDGRWTQTIDCRDETILQECRLLLREALRSHGVADSTATSVEVALTELWRNVAQHALAPVARIDIAINYRFKRCLLTVSSAGPPFTLDSALSKYRDVHCGDRRVHGLENLVSRGSLRVLRTSDVNSVQFSCVLAQTGSSDRAFISLELHDSYVMVGNNRHAYKEWLLLMGRGTEFGDQTPADKIAALLNKLVQESGGAEPVQVQTVRRPPEWTLSSGDIAAIETFDEVMQSLRSDTRFTVRDTDSADTPEPGQAEADEPPPPPEQAVRSFQMRCPHCASTLTAQEDWVGCEGECPDCGGTIVIQKE